MDYEVIKHDQINELISQELATIIKQNYGVDIYSMSQVELNKFLKSVFRKKDSTSRKILWWALQQGVRFAMPLVYLKAIPLYQLLYKG